jgi:hypothetical protein
MRYLRHEFESGILFSFDTDFYRRVKSRDLVEPWRGAQGRAFTPALILFISLPENENNADPG